MNEANELRVHHVNTLWNQALCGRQFDVIVLPYEPSSAAEWEYFKLVLTTRLDPNGYMMVEKT